MEGGGQLHIPADLPRRRKFWNLTQKMYKDSAMSLSWYDRLISREYISQNKY